MVADFAAGSTFTVKALVMGSMPARPFLENSTVMVPVVASSPSMVILPSSTATSLVDVTVAVVPFTAAGRASPERTTDGIT